MMLIRLARLTSGNARSAMPEEESVHSMATTTKQWTLADLERLPDDGNKYEVIHGQLFVTPAPRPDHERVLARLSALLQPYVASNDLGCVYHPRSVVRFRDSEVEPDLMVRREPSKNLTNWVDAPVPLLVVEVLSDYTRRRDHVQKREFYLQVQIPEYWIVDIDQESIRVVMAAAATRSSRSSSCGRLLALEHPS
jgi:Uma2 family endonuclease